MTHKLGERKKSSSREREAIQNLIGREMVVFSEGREGPIALGSEPQAAHAARLSYVTLPPAVL